MWRLQELKSAYLVMGAYLEHGYSWDADPRLQLPAAYVAILAEGPSFFCLAY